jgi:hypothetical protein
MRELVFDVTQEDDGGFDEIAKHKSVSAKTILRKL